MLIWNRWNKELTGRIYFNIYRKKPTHTPDTPHVHPLSWQLEWTNQKHFYCFLLKSVRENLVPGFPRALRPWSSCAEEFWDREWCCVCYLNSESAFLIFALSTLSVTSPCFGSWSQSNAVLSSVCWMGVGAGTRALLESSCACLVAARPRASICVSTVNAQNWEKIDSTESIDDYNVDKKKLF